MDAKLQRRIQRYGWDRAVAHYERFWGEPLRPAQARLREMADLRPGERVVDIACGTGLVTFPAAEVVGPTGTVVGTDISEAMVQSVCAEAARRDLSNVTAERRDAEDLGLPDDFFDAALCALGLMYVPDPLRAFQEMRRVLKPGGRVVAAVWGERNRCGWAEIFPIVDARVQSEVCPLFFRLGTGNTLRQTMEAAGFVVGAVERLSVRLRYDSPEAALGAAFAGGPVAMAYSRFDDRTRNEAHAEYLASIAPYRVGSGGYEIPGEFVLGCGRRL